MRNVNLESLSCLMPVDTQILVDTWSNSEDECFYIHSDDPEVFETQTAIETNPYKIDFEEFFTVLKKFKVCKVEIMNDAGYVSLEAPTLKDFLNMYDIDWHNCRFCVEVYSSDESERKYNETFSGNFDEVFGHFKRIEYVLSHILVHYEFKNGVYTLKFYAYRDALNEMYD